MRSLKVDSFEPPFRLWRDSPLAIGEPRLWREANQKSMKHLTVLFSLTLLHASTQGQFSKPAIITANTSDVKSITDHSPVMSQACHGSAMADSQQDWAINLHRLSPSHDVPDPEGLKQIKSDKLEQKLEAETQSTLAGEAGSRTVTPVVGINFLGNEMHSGSPPDNTIAVSNGGLIVAVDNATIEYYNTSGQYLMIREEHSDFFNDATLTSTLYDPRVIYDSGSDRFIFVLLHGNSSGTSKVLVSFSKTNDPQDGWWVYQFPGNPLSDGSWFDYPNIAVSNNELYVTGNLFFNSGNFNTAVVYQIDKADGFAGGSIDWQYWQPNGFTLVPLPWGQQGNYGPGILLVSSASNGDNQITVWDLTDDLSGSPQLNAYTYNVSAYSPPGYALQQGSSDVLDNGDCRVQNGFYLNNYIHFTLTDDYTSGYGGLFYCRINISNGNVQDETFGLSGYDYAFPSVGSFASSTSDNSVMISCLRSASNIYPETRVVNCDNLFDWSTSVEVKAGETYVDILGSTERWGDFSTICRKHNASQPTLWMSGCFGDNNFYVNHGYSAWIAEIKGSAGGVAPVANFVGNPTSGNAPLIVNFTDQSTNSPSQWSWSFTGGTPPTSASQNPTITYLLPGTYTVSLTSTNAFGNDTEQKNNYIQVGPGTGISDPLTTDVKVFPNPVRDLVFIEFELVEPGHLDILLIDVAGKLIKTLHNDLGRTGKHELSFNKGVLEAGTYFVVINHNEKPFHREKIVVLD